MEGMIAWVFLGLFVYFFPWMVAHQRRHKNRVAIFALTLFLGWTFLGWVIALIWGLTSNVEPTEQAQVKPSANEKGKAA